MTESASIKEKLAKLRKERLRSFIKNLIFIAIIATLLGVGCIWLGMKNVFFFVFLALSPLLLSILWDKKPGRFASKTVAAFNITGMFPYIMAISSSGSPDSVALAVMYDPKTWVLILGFAVFGWAVILLIPKITMIFLEIRSKFLIKKMEAFQQDLLDEWGEDIKK
jgi:nicotinamide riboside transporter PnuC